MTETNMPAVEATEGTERELNSYELAFHVLPTIAEGEVKTVFDTIKATITKLGGTLGVEEAPARFDLAYDIVQYLEGKNRKFSSAYFGWVRFEMEPAKIAELTEMVEGSKELLRHLLTRLSKVEAENPFYFHPAIADRVVETIIAPAEEVVAAEEVEGEVVEEVEKVEDGEEDAAAV
jgi:ribosomal protein S6